MSVGTTTFSSSRTLEALLPENYGTASVEIVTIQESCSSCPKVKPCEIPKPCEQPCEIPKPCEQSCEVPKPCEQPCAKPDPCSKPCRSRNLYMWDWLGAALLWFIVFTVLFWLVYYSLKPSYVLEDDGQVDTAKVLLAAVITAILLLIIVWLIKLALSWRY